MEDLTLIIPAKNESESLPSVLEEIKDYSCKKIVILESIDTETINSIKEYNCKLVYQTDKGYGNALIEGMKCVETNYLCIFNADGSFDPLELKKMLSKINEKNYDYDLLITMTY